MKVLEEVKVLFAAPAYVVMRRTVEWEVAEHYPGRTIPGRTLTNMSNYN